MTHAKAIFFGEHSVVYGKKGITIPLPEMTVKATLIKTNEVQKRDEILQYICEQCKIDNKTKVVIESKIPVGRGLGSSAALSIAIARANNCNNIREIANRCEKFIHGNPSGIDVNQVLSDTPLIFSKNDGAKPIEFNLDCFLLIIDTGIVGITKNAVERVKNNYNKNEKYIERLGEITEKVITHLQNKDVINVGKLMDEAHYNLEKIGVSHPSNNEVVQICKEYGALGAKITGGGDGGCCIALVKSKDNADYIKNKLKEHGYLSWIVTV